MQSQIDFGYPWWLSYGQLAVLAVIFPIWLLGVSRRWPKGWLVLIGPVVVWALAASLVARIHLNPNERAALPTQSFLASGAGKVLDMGAGTGQSGQERLLANLSVAGVEKRATIQVGDMTRLPFEAVSFDGVKSALSDAERVLRPGGEFLLMVISKDLWLRVALGPLLLQEAGFQVVEQGPQPTTLYFLGRKL